MEDQRMRVMTVYGTRPEAIKVAPVIRALGRDPRFEAITVVTGQHREMLDQVNSVFEIVPDRDIDVFEPGLSLNRLMAKMFDRLDPILAEFRPDAVLVQGDTSSVTASAIASFYRGIPVVHLEAGLRSGSLSSPFPEEANRKLASQVASLHLAPTLSAKENLLRESVRESDVVVTGNTVIDALLLAIDSGRTVSSAPIATAIADHRPILLVTTHRRESWGHTMAGVGRAVRQLAEKYPHYLIVLPVHLNPIIRDSILPEIDGIGNVLICDPLPYGEFAQVMKAAHIILTDSGGIQEEAPSLGKPVLVLRDNTERPEAVAAGAVRLIGTQQERIVDEVVRLIESPEKYAAMANAVNPYGDGNASQRTLAALSELLGQGLRMADFVATRALP